MKLVLLSHTELSSLILPEKAAGQYKLRGRNASGRLVDIISVEAKRASSGESEWVAKSNRRFVILGSDSGGNKKILQSVTLKSLELYHIQSADGSLKFTLFTEPITSGRTQYKGYSIDRAEAVLTIGRNDGNSICYANKFTSGNHAELRFSNGKVYINDLGSTNNTYVNSRAVKQAELSTGDAAYIMGLKIIVTPKMIFINDPDGNVSVKTDVLREFHAPEYTFTDDEFEAVETEYFYRAPRFTNEVSGREINIDPPPANQGNDDTPMVMVMGPSLTMGMASVATGVFSIVSAIERGDFTTAVPSLVMCISMLLGTLMWPLITKSYQKKLRIKKEKNRLETYAKYLDKLEGIITQETASQKEILCAEDCSAGACEKRVLAPSPQIWERTPKHSDFLQIRLGTGRAPLKLNIRYTERKFSVEQDSLNEMMYSFGEKKRFVENVPICLPLREYFVSGIYGGKSVLYGYARNLILQLVTLHSYDEVKIVLIYDESQDFSFARWLPHTMNNERTVRYIATNSDEVKELSTSLDSVIEYRKSLSDGKLADESPYYVIIALDKELAAKAECVRRVLDSKENIGFSVLAAYERLVDLPKECMAVAEIGSGTGSLTVLDGNSAEPAPFRLDAAGNIDFNKVTNVLANTFVDITGSDFTLPKKYTFFEMLDIGMIEHLNIAENWAVSDPTKSLAVPIGIDKYGEPFKLDLHERAHGPHGLVAGMTGSGKSEFIISYILSMAVNFHPYEVAFILIDYKGGGMAKSFENIPHTAGVITNLDGNGIKRSLSSMRSELHRREKIFRDTSIKHNVSNIDIYKYQKLYREGKVSEPLPHLLIISDEFAELKKEQPDFMTELTSTARVGRSLGVHLILATQKPGGVVDDQIRSNSRFKICLKVQDSGDSREMLGRPEAAALVDTGRFYLQVGYDELFEMGQSAWAGAPYYPSQKTIKDRGDAVAVINTNGRVIAEANTNRFAEFSDPPKQLDVITNYIAKYCEEEKITRWKMWLDPISPMIYVDRLAEKYKGSECGRFQLAPIAGEFDDPAHQRQGVLRVPLTTDGNAIIYGSAGNGKAMFLEAMCYSLMREHKPSEVNIYIMDFGAETFTAFSESPFIGDVILSYETEKVDNLFKLLFGKIETRKKILSEFGGSLEQYNLQAEKTQPNIIVMINNFAAFSELFEERLGDINYLTREGTKYGIYFVLACTGTNNVRFNMMQNFKLMYCLQMNSADDYSTVVGKTDGLYPEKFKGRGILRLDKDTVVEFQTASITDANPPYPAIRKFCAKLAEVYAEFKAQKVPVLPEKVTEEFLAPFARQGDLSRVPVGVEKASLEAAYFDFSAVVNLAISENGEWSDFSSRLAQLISKNCGVQTVVLSPENDNSGAECGRAVIDIFSVLCKRNNGYKTAVRNGLQPENYEPLFVVIQSLSRLEKLLEKTEPSGDAKIVEDINGLGGLFGCLKFIMQKCAAEYNIHFLICENAKELGAYTADDWYKAHVGGKDGLWLGNGISSQTLLDARIKSTERYAEIGREFGFVIKNSGGVPVKFLQ